MKFSELYQSLRRALSSVCHEAAGFEAREIAEAVTGLPHDRFALALADGDAVSEEQRQTAEDFLRRRLSHEPLAYILGYTDFCGRRFYVTPDCLIPRDDTEAVCQRMLSLLPRGARLADIGTGSGAIALTALCERSDAVAVGYDISPDALAMAEKNAEALSVARRFVPMQKDVFSEDFLEGEQFDLIVSNPPYIPSSVIQTLTEEVRREPILALDGGEDGLRFYRRLLDVCPPHIKKGGHLLFEIGYDEGDALRALCDARGLACEIFRDFGGNDRGALIFL